MASPLPSAVQVQSQGWPLSQFPCCHKGWCPACLVRSPTSCPALARPSPGWRLCVCAGEGWNKGLLLDSALSIPLPPHFSVFTSCSVLKSAGIMVEGEDFSYVSRGSDLRPPFTYSRVRETIGQSGQREKCRQRSRTKASFAWTSWIGRFCFHWNQCNFCTPRLSHPQVCESPTPWVHL